MLLIIIFTAFFILGIALTVHYVMRDGYYDGECIAGVFFTIVFGAALIINLCIWVPSKAESTILYHQLLSEKATIEAMLETDGDTDRLTLNQKVTDFNNRIIKARINSDRFIFKDYYNQDLDWAALELIEWR